MNLLEQIRLALRALSVNKLRSALTMLGIIIGVGAVITLLSVGQGVQDLVTRQLQSVGTNLLFVVSGNLEAGTTRTRGSSGLTLTLKDAEAIADPFNVPDVVAVAPEVLSGADVSYGRTTLRVTVSGVTPAYSRVRNFPVAYGSFIDETDLNTRARVAVLGSRIAERLFDNGAYPIGATIKINNIPFKVIGVLESKGGTGGPGGNQDEVLMVPLSTAHQRLFPRFFNRQGEPMLSVIYAQVVSEDRMEAASQEITELLRQRHGIRFQDEDDFTVINQRDLLAIFGQITGVLTIFLGAIAGISLLVGGIGIMNIMLVSVTERTREIGLRKAVGAKRRDIMMQFLIESVTLALVGGFFGILLGTGGAMGISRLQSDLTAVVTAQSVLLATGFSAAVGLFFGIYPATRASRLNPIEALRYE
ncbi:MAG: ABC transporter permease [Anaerolineae bacterium]|nr:ABC transporter permease [Anaerolineae bacterium]